MKVVFVFVGHDFFGTDKARKQAYREVIAQAFVKANRDIDVRAKDIKFVPVFADTRPGDIIPLWRSIRARRRHRQDGRYWMKIRTLIAECKYALFDLTFRDNSAPFNANVLLEFGVAIGMKKKIRSFGNSRENFKRYLSDQAGYDFPQYITPDELRQVVKDLLLHYLDAKAQ